MKKRRWQFAIPLLFFAFFVSFAVNLAAEEPCVSGLKPGQKPKPYSFVVATGPERGQSTCYICETADRPAVVIFARDLGDPLGKLVAKLDKALADHKKAELRAWVTFLSDDQPKLDPKVVKWGKKHAIRTLRLGVFEEAAGPPAYRLSRDADVTILLFVKRKIVANFAFRPGELTDERAAEVLKALPRIVEEKK
jgi:hypothetical protein